MAHARSKYVDFVNSNIHSLIEVKGNRTRLFSGTLPAEIEADFNIKAEKIRELSTFIISNINTLNLASIPEFVNYFRKFTEELVRDLCVHKSWQSHVPADESFASFILDISKAYVFSIISRCNQAIFLHELGSNASTRLHVMLQQINTVYFDLVSSKFDIETQQLPEIDLKEVRAQIDLYVKKQNTSPDFVLAYYLFDEIEIRQPLIRLSRAVGILVKLQEDAVDKRIEPVMDIVSKFIDQLEDQIRDSSDWLNDKRVYAELKTNLLAQLADENDKFREVISSLQKIASTPEARVLPRRKSTTNLRSEMTSPLRVMRQSLINDVKKSTANAGKSASTDEAAAETQLKSKVPARVRRINLKGLSLNSIEALRKINTTYPEEFTGSSTSRQEVSATSVVMPVSKTNGRTQALAHKKMPSEPVKIELAISRLLKLVPDLTIKRGRSRSIIVR